MNEFKTIVRKYFNEGMTDIQNLNGFEQREACQAFLSETEDESQVAFIMAGLFPNMGYLSSKCSGEEISKHARNIFDAFDYEVKVLTK